MSATGQSIFTNHDEDDAAQSLTDGFHLPIHAHKKPSTSLIVSAPGFFNGRTALASAVSEPMNSGKPALVNAVIDQYRPESRAAAPGIRTHKAW